MSSGKKGRVLSDDKFESVLSKAKRVVVIGLSRNEYKASNIIARQLAEKYEVVGVNPAGDVEGFKTYSDIEEMAGEVGEADIVVVFRPSEEVGEIAEKLLKSGLKFQVLWMQEGIENEGAAKLLIEQGIDVVMNRCMGKALHMLEKNF